MKLKTVRWLCIGFGVTLWAAVILGIYFTTRKH